MKKNQFLSPEQLRRHSSGIRAYMFQDAFLAAEETIVTVQENSVLPSGKKGKNRTIAGTIDTTATHGLPMTSSRPMYYGHKPGYDCLYHETLSESRSGLSIYVRNFVKSFKFIRHVCPQHKEKA